MALCAAVRTSSLPVGEAGGPAEFPGNFLEGHAEGRVPGRIGPETTDDSAAGGDSTSFSTHVLQFLWRIKMNITVTHSFSPFKLSTQLK